MLRFIIVVLILSSLFRRPPMGWHHRPPMGPHGMGGWGYRRPPMGWHHHPPMGGPHGMGGFHGMGGGFRGGPHGRF